MAYSVEHPVGQARMVASGLRHKKEVSARTRAPLQYDYAHLWEPCLARLRATGWGPRRRLSVDTVNLSDWQRD